jgi:hypothetical protein
MKPFSEVDFDLGRRDPLQIDIGQGELARADVLVGIDAERVGAVTLRVGVEQANGIPDVGERCRDGDGARGFSAAALLIRECDDLSVLESHSLL